MSKSLNNPLFRLNAFLIAIFILAGCSEKSIPISLNDPSLKVGTVEIPVTYEQQKGIVPDMGSLPTLYLGGSDYVDIPVTLLNFHSLSSGGLGIYLLDDSSAVLKRSILRGTLKLTLADSAYLGSTVELLIINNSVDSIFSENESNFKNFNINDYDVTIISEAIPTYGVYSDTISRYSLKFDLSGEFFNWVSDSLNMLNGINLAIRPIDSEVSLLKYFSKNNKTFLQPLLFMEYEREIPDTMVTDTLTAFYGCFENLSIVIPDTLKFPDLSSSEIIIGNSLGSVGGLMFDINSNDFPPQSLITSALLNLQTIESDSTNPFAVSLSGITGLGNNDDPYDVVDNYSAIFQFSDLSTDVSLKTIVQMLVSANVDTLLGVRLSSAKSNDPFTQAILSINQTDSLRIEYVYPE